MIISELVEELELMRGQESRSQGAGHLYLYVVTC
jgi:hypothetical protein